MDGRAASERALTNRIIAVLLALAGLAERAACAPRVVRFVMLAILRRGELVVRDFVLWEAWDAGVTPRLFAPAQSGNEPDDALRLAMSFRLLALTLSELALLQLDTRSAHAALRPVCTRLHLPPRRLGQDFRELLPHDTS